MLLMRSGNGGTPHFNIVRCVRHTGEHIEQDDCMMARVVSRLSRP
jgi:hypothetical protein